MSGLYQHFEAAALRYPDNVSVRCADKSLRYHELRRKAIALSEALRQLGVRRGDRVGVWLPKSVEAVAAMLACLRVGAAYIPIDSFSPPERVRRLASDCEFRAVFCRKQASASGVFHESVCLLEPEVDTDRYGDESEYAAHMPAADELAYILYTSGSTGVPKGVCISHRNALAFVRWAASTLEASQEDRFGNHAPFHFDLSVLDLYVPLGVGGLVELIPEQIAYRGDALVELVNQTRLSVWYSVPSALSLMMSEGGLCEAPPDSLRAILFAGEVFPIDRLKTLRRAFPTTRLLNLYGPTETNVCTYYEVPASETLEARLTPVPIGKACCGDRVWAVDPEGREVAPGGEGELMVTGPTVMLAYWGNPVVVDRAYATGDIVRREEDGNFSYRGRRDLVVKVRGYRIELGDIEAALVQHPAVDLAAVTTVGEGLDKRIHALVVPGEGRSLSLIEAKQQCARLLPRYMIVDRLHLVPQLPITRNGKIDRTRLPELLGHRRNVHQV